MMGDNVKEMISSGLLSDEQIKVLLLADIADRIESIEDKLDKMFTKKNEDK